MSYPKLGLIWAQSVNGIIGNKNKLPWFLPEDLKHFSEITSGSTVVMGKNTWLSLPKEFQPLPNRKNFILSKSGFKTSGAQTVATVEEVLHQATTEWVWVIGGGEVYRSTIFQADRLEVTFVNCPETIGDTYAPPIPEKFFPLKQTISPKWLQSFKGTNYRFVSYVKMVL